MSHSPECFAPLLGLHSSQHHRCSCPLSRQHPRMGHLVWSETIPNTLKFFSSSLSRSCNSTSVNRCRAALANLYSLRVTHDEICPWVAALILSNALSRSLQYTIAKIVLCPSPYLPELDINLDIAFAILWPGFFATLLSSLLSTALIGHMDLASALPYDAHRYSLLSILTVAEADAERCSAPVILLTACDSFNGQSGNFSSSICAFVVFLHLRTGGDSPCLSMLRRL